MDVNEILVAATETAAPVETVAPAAVETVEAKTEETVSEEAAETVVEETKVETPELKAATEKLRAAAMRRQTEQEHRRRIEEQHGQVTRQNAELQARLEKLESRAAQIEAFERDPIEWLEQHSQDPVAFLQNAHRVALNAPATNAERIAKEALARTERLEKRGDPAEITQSALQAQATRDAQISLVAESEKGDYPLFAMQAPEERIALATRVAKQLVKEGNTSFDYPELCAQIEERLTSDLEAKNKVRAAAKPQTTKTPPATNGTPTTVTATIAAADKVSVTKMTQQQLDEAADRLIEQEFFGH